MNEGSPRLLFIPVSGAWGMGEYARALAIAQGAAARWPNAAIHFLLSRAAPYSVGTPFPKTLLDSSPTFHTRAVTECIEQWRPDLVIFDNAGRTAQLRAAHRSGARVIFVSARRRQRSKAFRMRWMRLIDEHWIAYPEFIAGSLSAVERLKLRFWRRPVVRYLDVILATPRPSSAPLGAGQSLESRWGVGTDGYVLIVPGGGTGHPGAVDAIQTFREVADTLAATGVVSLFVGGVAPPASSTMAAADISFSAAGAGTRVLGPLPQSELTDLMRGARIVIANGGSTLLQAIACGRACVAVPIAGDQSERIGRCARAGVAIRAPLEKAAILRAVRALLDDESQREALAGRTIAVGLTDGIGVAVRAMGAMLAARQEEPRMPNALLLGYDLQLPSYRHRMRSIVAPLENAGWQVRSERLPSGRYGLRTWERRELLRWADVAVLHQIKFSGLEARLFAALAKHSIFDVDDAIYVRKPRRLCDPVDESVWRRRKFAATSRWVSVVAAGNQVLANVARRTAREIAILPTSIDTADYHATRAAPQDAPTVVWIGSPENLIYLDMIRPVLARLTGRYPGLTMRVICSKFPEWTDVAVERVIWSQATEAAALAGAHIGVMPLSDDEWSRGKCAFKLLQYMAASLPCVASPVGANTEAVIDGVNGFHARGAAEWERGLERLLESAVLRARFGAAGRAHVEERYAMHRYQSRYVELLGHVCGFEDRP